MADLNCCQDQSCNPASDPLRTILDDEGDAARTWDVRDLTRQLVGFSRTLSVTILPRLNEVHRTSSQLTRAQGNSSVPRDS